MIIEEWEKHFTEIEIGNLKGLVKGIDFLREHDPLIFIEFSALTTLKIKAKSVLDLQEIREEVIP